MSALTKYKKQDGSIIIWLVAGVPIFVIIFSLFVNVIVMIDAKMTLQSAVDRGAYAGAAYLSHVMNRVAALNREFRNEYRKLRDIFERSEESVETINKKVAETNYNQGLLYNDMQKLLEEGYGLAHKIAAAVALKNLEGLPQIVSPQYDFSLVPSDPMFSMENECPNGQGECINKETLVPFEIEGESIDPTKYTPHPKLLHKYLVKSDDFVSMASLVRARFASPLLPRFFDGSGLVLGAASAAQPYGGSIKGFANLENESVGDSILYHPILIPLRLVEGGAGASR